MMKAVENTMFAGLIMVNMVLCQGCWNAGPSQQGIADVPVLYEQKNFVCPHRMDSEALKKLREGLKSIEKGMCYTSVVDLLGTPDEVHDLYDHRHVINFSGRHKPIGFSAFYIISQDCAEGSVVQRAQTAVVLRFDREGRLLKCQGHGELQKYDVMVCYGESEKELKKRE